MARGSKPGERRGGRKVGSKNWKTLQKERLANEEAARRAREAELNPAKPLAKDVLENIMFAALSDANFYKPARPNEPPNPNANADMYFRSLDMALASGKAAAAFQSPTFKAIEYRPVLPVLQDDQKRNGDDAKVIDIKDAKVQGQIYMRLIKSRASK